MDCSICLEIATSFTQLSCGHKFHLKCIVGWLSKKQTCPCCRKATNETESVVDETIELEIRQLVDVARQAYMSLSVMRDEKERLENIVINGLVGREKELYMFSKVLHKVSPSLFKDIIYADDGCNEVRFKAFLPDRLRIADEASKNPKWERIYNAFTNNLLSRINAVAMIAASRKVKTTRADSVWEQYI